MERNMYEIKEWARNLMNELLTNNMFNSFLSVPMSRIRLDVKKALADQFGDAVEVHFGATRVVIMTDDKPYVLKIQYCDKDYDYGKNELLVYTKAVEQGLDKYFAWTEKLFSIDFENGRTVDVYIQEKCEMDEDDMTNRVSNYAYSKWLDEENLEDCSDSRDKYEIEEDTDYITNQEFMMEYAEEEWGTAAWDVSEFLDSMYVNDCHSGNWGWRDHELVICDYAGYMRDVRGVENV